jgi:hypothetical protein
MKFRVYLRNILDGEVVTLDVARLKDLRTRVPWYMDVVRVQDI